MAKRNRTHKYHRVEIFGSKLWACALSDCNHNMPKHYEPMIMGKATICWQCGNETVLDPVNIKMDQPICMDCQSGHGSSRDHEVVVDIAESDLTDFLSTINKRG